MPTWKAIKKSVAEERKAAPKEKEGCFGELHAERGSDQANAIKVNGPESTYEVVPKRVAVRATPDADSRIVLVAFEGERICGVPHEVNGVPWLRVSAETLQSHPLKDVVSDEDTAWAIIDATNTHLELGQLLKLAPAEAGWCAPKSATKKRSEVWEVVCACGVVASTEKDAASRAELELLSAGALVKVLERDSSRLRYQLIAGNGPESGWVSSSANGEDLLVKVGREHARRSEDDQELAQTSGMEDSLVPVQDAKRAEEALRHYSQELTKAREGNAIFNRQSFCWLPLGLAAAEAPEQDLCAEIKRDLASQRDLRAEAVSKVPANETGAAREPDEEAPIRCTRCRLPVGDVFYNAQGPLHGECIAQALVTQLTQEEQARLDKQRKVKLMRRAQYDIGWSAQRIPCNGRALGRLVQRPVPRGMCCLSLPEGADRVRVASTVDPAASVNLEYLSLALQVRVREGSEPLFSLDPVDPDVEDSMQVKRFEPHWLKGTSVGEVLFQADYYLKELSMGEYGQPVAGMRSCLDFVEEDGRDKAWSAREWFVVKKAEVQASSEGGLIPFCKLGVEAREQVVNDDGGLEDLRVTRQSHPLVKYAEAFTRNFDLIAERKSCVYHLRELAKASILAKYLVESAVDLEDAWFGLQGQQSSDCVLEIPQLWNDRCLSSIRVRDGGLLGGGGTTVSSSTHGIYGGVRFGLDKFRMAGRGAAGGVMAARHPLGGRLVPRAGAAAGIMSSQRVFGRGMPARLAPSQRMIGTGAGPRGVDLNLDRFNLTEATAAEKGRPVVCDSNLDTCAMLGAAFWRSLDDDAGSEFPDKDRDFLRSVFHPVLSDRRDDGELFTPPEASFAYVQKLRSLLQAEESSRKRRKDHFFGPGFAMGDAGPLFPSSWTSPVEITDQSVKGSAALQARPDYKARAYLFGPVLESSTPVFDKSTEDGLRFRVYRCGSVEVRTTQEHGGGEEVGAVFSRKRSPAASRTIEEDEKIAKVSQYVERNPEPEGGADFHCYVVLETQGGGVIVTERLKDGVVTWEEHPNDVEDRNSLARLLRRTDCSAGYATVRHMKLYQQARTFEQVVPQSHCNLYADRAYFKAAGTSHQKQQEGLFASTLAASLTGRGLDEVVDLCGTTKKAIISALSAA